MRVEHMFQPGITEDYQIDTLFHVPLQTIPLQKKTTMSMSPVISLLFVNIFLFCMCIHERGFSHCKYVSKNSGQLNA